MSQPKTELLPEWKFCSPQMIHLRHDKNTLTNFCHRLMAVSSVNDKTIGRDLLGIARKNARHTVRETGVGCSDPERQLCCLSSLRVDTWEGGGGGTLRMSWR